MSIYLLFGLAILFFIVRFFYKNKRNSSTESNSNNNIDFAQNIEVNCNATEPESPIESLEHPIINQNSFLNSNDDFGTLIKGVVLDNQTYEYEVKENDCSNFTIIEMGDESEEITE